MGGLTAGSATIFVPARPDDRRDVGGIFRSGGHTVSVGAARYLAHQRHARGRRLSCTSTRMTHRPVTCTRSTRRSTCLRKFSSIR